MASARLAGTAMIFCAAIVADDSAECSARQHAALGLKAGLEKAGMTVHVGLDVRTSPNGLGVFVTEAVDEGAPIFTYASAPPRSTPHVGTRADTHVDTTHGRVGPRGVYGAAGPDGAARPVGPHGIFVRPPLWCIGLLRTALPPCLLQAAHRPHAGV